MDFLQQLAQALVIFSWVAGYLNLLHEYFVWKETKSKIIRLEESLRIGLGMVKGEHAYQNKFDSRVRCLRTTEQYLDFEQLMELDIGKDVYKELKPIANMRAILLDRLWAHEALVWTIAFACILSLILNAAVYGP